MKRIALLLVALAVAGAFAACEQKKKDAAPEPAVEPAQPATPPPTAAGEQPAGGQPATTAPAEPADKEVAGDAASTGIPECDAYIKRLMDCKSYPPQGKDALRKSSEGWKKAHEAGADAAKAAADACKKQTEQSDQSLKGMNC